MLSPCGVHDALLWRKRDIIVCPECGNHVPAFIEMHEDCAWPSWVSECWYCGYYILESEWESVL